MDLIWKRKKKPLRPEQRELDGAGGGAGGGGGGGGVTAKPCRNGLMGANELGMWHHNAERPLVHLGARVPMQPWDKREG